MEQKTILPIIDWAQALKVAGNQQTLAEDLLTCFTKGLPDEIANIKHFHSAKNYSEMLRVVHKLHGALCYCGLPRLKSVVSILETHLKNNIMESLTQGVEVLDAEAKLLLEHHSHLSRAATASHAQ